MRPCIVPSDTLAWMMRATSHGVCTSSKCSSRLKLQPPYPTLLYNLVNPGECPWWSQMGVSDRGAEGPCLTDFVSVEGSPRGSSTTSSDTSSSNSAEAPSPPPFSTPVPNVAQACQSSHGLALVSRLGLAQHRS
ncbi:hypothetical protein DUNSADRAFT_10981 [Dunaliella salina]|uniref:Encoded protein n=1 Tax=Dunaliella salina TaxID=3046 RepID=A0ABQ7GED3_DUNSA|nr:hypothetical protein DUNSADRAFT_10981 [Dunaliella salina]|eukprot:KAF5832964.1 hypothetical protein DUNSADRAFT_10981 [Dunaliella salina]